LRANVRKNDVVIQAHRTEQEYDKIKIVLLFIVLLFNSYFESDDMDNDSYNKTKNKKIDDDLDYLPAPGSPSYQAGKKDEEDDDDEDPLEQFMKANNNQAKQDLAAVGKKKEKKQEK
jgi:hypothetical protein